MLDPENFGNETFLSVLQDPFAKKHVTSVAVSTVLIMGSFVSGGHVSFQNGNTTGTQHFQGDNFDHIILQIKAFVMEELKD